MSDDLEERLSALEAATRLSDTNLRAQIRELWETLLAQRHDVTLCLATIIGGLVTQDRAAGERILESLTVVASGDKSRVISASLVEHLSKVLTVEDPQKPIGSAEILDFSRRPRSDGLSEETD